VSNLDAEAAGCVLGELECGVWIVGRSNHVAASVRVDLYRLDRFAGLDVQICWEDPRGCTDSFEPGTEVSSKAGSAKGTTTDENGRVTLRRTP
jgi:hypothetical protein